MSRCWIKVFERTKIDGGLALIASPGLRSAGWLAINFLIEKIKPSLIAKIFSTSFPIQHETIPTYNAQPDARGVGGVFVDSGLATEPSVEVYRAGGDLMIVRGYQANFYGQRETAEKTVELLEQLGASLIIGLAAHATGKGDLCIAATKPELVEHYSRTLKAEAYQGPLLGFTGLTLGEAAIRDIDAICILTKTTTNDEFPEQPDYEAAKKLVRAIISLLKLEIDPFDLENFNSKLT